MYCNAQPSGEFRRTPPGNFGERHHRWTESLRGDDAAAGHQWRGWTHTANAGKACCALAGRAAYEIYLTVRTGTWDAWAKAQQAGWDLHLATPYPGPEDHLVVGVPAPVQRRLRVRVPAGAGRDGRDAPGHARVPGVAPLARGRVLRPGRARARHADLVPGLPATYALSYHPVTTKLAAQAGGTFSRYAPGDHQRPPARPSPGEGDS